MAAALIRRTRGEGNLGRRRWTSGDRESRAASSSTSRISPTRLPVHRCCTTSPAIRSTSALESARPSPTSRGDHPQRRRVSRRAALRPQPGPTGMPLKASISTPLHRAGLAADLGSPSRPCPHLRLRSSRRPSHPPPVGRPTCEGSPEAAALPKKAEPSEWAVISHWGRPMKILIAGATGALRRAARSCARAPWTRRDRADPLVVEARAARTAGARVAIGNALDADDMTRVVADAAPTHIVHMLTALPAAGPLRARDLRPTKRICASAARANLVRAGIDARRQADRRRICSSASTARRTSIGRAAKTTRRRRRSTDRFHEADLAIRSMEDQLRRARDAKQIENRRAALRWRLLVRRWRRCSSHAAHAARQRLFLARARCRARRHAVRSIVDDAAAATIAALEHPSPSAVATSSTIDRCR